MRFRTNSYKAGLSSLAVMVFVSSATVTGAATLENVRGSISVRTAAGVPATSTSAPIVSGDRVRAGPDGYAEIVYASGCREIVDAGRIVVVKPEEVANTLVRNGVNCGAAAASAFLPHDVAIAAGVVAAGAIILLSKPASP